MTVLRLSIHIGSMSPSKIIHFGCSTVLFACSRINVDNRPSFHSRVAALMMPNSSLFVTLFGFRSLTMGLWPWFLYVACSVFQICDFPVPALPTMNTECRTANNSSSCTTYKKSTTEYWNGSQKGPERLFCPSLFHHYLQYETIFSLQLQFGCRFLDDFLKIGRTLARHIQRWKQIANKSHEHWHVIGYDFRRVEIAQCTHQDLVFGTLTVAPLQTLCGENWVKRHWQTSVTRFNAHFQCTGNNKHRFNGPQAPVIMVLRRE